MKKGWLVLLAVGTTAAGVALSMLVLPRLVSDPHARAVAPARGAAQWADHYDSLAEMLADVDVVVLARHLSAAPGRVEDAPDDPLPFTNNRFETLRVLQGEVQGTFLVEQTGGRVGEVQYSIDDGGPYADGDRYLLFLKQQPDTGYYYLVNSQGRYHSKAGKLQAVVRDPVTAPLHGKSEQEAQELLARSAP